MEGALSSPAAAFLAPSRQVAHTGSRSHRARRVRAHLAGRLAQRQQDLVRVPLSSFDRWKRHVPKAPATCQSLTDQGGLSLPLLASRRQPQWRGRRSQLRVACLADDEEGTNAPPAPLLTTIDRTVAALELDVEGFPYRFETGKVGNLANGAIWATQGDTVLYTTVCCSREASSDGSFLPLSVHYQERLSANGLISRGFIKREAKPRQRDVLTARLIDRPIRPMFPKGLASEVQVLSWVLSFNGTHGAEPLAITTAGVALAISDIPFAKPVAGARVGYIDGQIVVNASDEKMESSQLDMIIAGTEDAVLMIEGYADVLPEETMLDAISAAQEKISEVCKQIKAWVEKVGKEKTAGVLNAAPEGLKEKVQASVGTEVQAAMQVCERLSHPTKQHRRESWAEYNV
eukprot:scaffold389_cov382-Prasinococcus_capsulatus_cf.AAC.22